MKDGEKPVPFFISTREEPEAPPPSDPQVRTLKFLNGSTADTLFRNIDAPFGSAQPDQTAPLPPVAIPFPRPGRTVELELTSAAEVETEEPAPPSPWLVGPSQIVKVSPQAPPAPGEFQYDENAPNTHQSRAGRASSRSPGKEISINYDSPRIKLGAEIDPVVIESEQAGPLPDWVPTIEPQVPGQWRWLDTTTLQFEAKEEFARATTFRIQTPCKTRWSFTTAPPSCRTNPIHHELDLQPDLEVHSDLDTDWEAQSEYVVLSPDGGTEPIPLEHQETRKSYYTYGRFRPCRPLERDTKYRFQLLPGVKSLIGPNPSQSQETINIRTYGDLDFRRSRVRCAPQRGYAVDPSELWEIVIEFTNRLSTEAFQQHWVQVSPPLAEAQIFVSGNSLNIRGKSPGGAVEIRVSAELRDLYGQRLGGELEIEEQLERPRLLFFLDRSMRVLPVQNPVFSFFAQSIPAVEVVVYPVRPEQWPDYLEHTTRRDCRFSNDGHSSVLAIEPSTVPKAVHIDLGHFLHQRPGHCVVQVRARKPVCDQAITEGRNQVGIAPEPEPEFGAWQSCWIQVTDLCPALIQSFETIRGRVVDGRTGQLIKNSTVSTFEDHRSREYMLVATETDRAFLSTSEIRYCTPRLIVYGFSDRKLYKPGETASIKLWAWERPAPGLLPKSAAGRKLPYKLRGPDWSYSLEGEVSLSADGSADLELKLPKELQLGYHKLLVGLQADQLFDEVPIQIEEFRRPKFEVGLQGPEQSEIGDTLTYTVRARSFSGADLSGATTNISFNRKPINYRPPGWSKFLFGHRRFWFNHPAVPENSRYVSSELSPDGSKTFDLTLDGLETARTYVVEAHASVDLDRQQQAASHRHILHSSSLDLGIKMSRIVYGAQDDISFKFIVTDHQGQPVSGQRVQFQVDDEDFFECVSQSKPSGLTLKTERRGYLTIHGRAIDKRGLASSTQVMVYRLGGFATFSEKKELSALLDKRTYRVGETARLTLLCPQQGTYFLRVVNGAEVDSAEGFAAAGECVLEFPVTETLRGGGKVHVDLVTPGDKMGPLVYRASQDFQVELSDLELLVELTPSETMAAPGDEIETIVRVTDLDGNPMADTEVALVVVDEAILFAGNYRIPEPLERLYPSQIDRTQSRHLWEENRMPDLVELAALMQREHGRMLACSMAAPASDESEKPKGHVRRNFAPLAHFAPCLKTDPQGRVRTAFVLPDSLSRFRLTAVVVTSDRRAGYAEAQIQVTKPVLLETSFPRFLSPGDVSFLPITVRNLTDKQRIVEVGLRGTGIRLLEEAAATVTLEPRGACEVPFRAEVKDVPELVLQSVVRSGREQDAVEQTIPVYRAASTETMAQCGQLVEEACSFGLHWPAGALPGFGGLSVELATTALQGLDGAYRYILSYSYGCVEQLACKLAATVSLNDYLDAYRPQEVPDREARDQMTADWIEQILSRKRGTNFSYWPGRMTSYEYPNLVAYHALALAHHAGYSTPGLQPKGVQQELQTIKFSSLLPDELKAFFEAYLLWVRVLWGDESARQISPSMKNAGIEAWTFMMRLSPRWQTEGVRLIQNAVTETATTASLRRETSYLMRYSFGGLQRSNAFALLALLEAAPENPLVSKFMTGLQAHRVQGRWRNTQENLFAILALGSYFKAREAVEPDLKAAAWLGERQFIGRAFQGRETERFRARLPAEKVSRANPATVVLQSVGRGRLYHRTELTWAVDCRELKPLARGFSLERTYTFVSGDGESERQLAPGAGPMKVCAGDKLRVRLSIHSRGPRYHVALVDPFPGGFEPINPRLKSQGQTQVRG